MALRLVLVSGGLSLSLAACQLPSFTPFGYVAVSGPVTCVSQSSLQVGQACSVTCEPNSTNVGGNALFACGVGDVLVSPTLKCEPSCQIPPFSTGVVGSTSNGSAFPCSPGALCRSCTCDVTCDTTNNFTLGVGSSSYVCTANGLLRGGTLRCFPCILPSAFSIPHLVPSNATGACSPGAGLPNSTSCNLTCDSNYIQSGNSSYFCDAGAVLRPPNMTCSSQPCTLPSIVLPFVAGSCNSSILSPGTTCSVQCDSQHSPAGGDANFYCDSLVARTPTLQCVPDNCTAVLPPSQNYAFDSDLDNACSAGGVILSNSSCNIGCALGFEAISGSDSLSCFAGVVNSSLVCMAASCAFFPVLPPGHVPINCSLGGTGNPGATIRHGSSCRVGCATGYTGTEQLFACNFGQVTGPPAFCVPNSCTLPSFATGMLGNSNGAHNSSCTPGGVLNSSSTCDVMCDNSTYAQSAGTFSYACYLGVFTVQPTAQCVPFGGCVFPSIPCLQSQTCMGGTTGSLCSGSALTNGTSCGLTCVSTFTANTSATANLTCNNGTLSTVPDTSFCVPTSCTVSFAALGILGDVTGCRDGSNLTHNQSCTLGCNSSLQLVVGAQAGSTVKCLYGVASILPNSFSNPLCRVPACTLPLSLPVGFAFQPNATTGGCVPGAVLENYPSDSSCSVRCDQGYSGSATYTCSKTGLALSGTCAVQECSYTVSSLTGIVAGNSIECNETACELTPGTYSLPNGSCCDYQCDIGYHIATTNTSLRLVCPSTPTNCGNFSTCTTSPSIDEVRCKANTCTVPPLNTSVVGVGGQACVVGTVLKGSGSNSSCDVGCLPGYAPTGGTTSYSCALGVLTNASLSCAPLSCTLPPLLFQQQNNSNGTHSLGCTAGLVLQSGQSCDVQCGAATGVPGTLSYSCRLGNLTTASVICLSQGACLLPTNYSRGIFVAGPTPCPYGLGESLENGNNCTVQCELGFNATSGNSSVYSCVNGSLIAPALSCSPKPCNIAFADPLMPSARTDRCNMSQGLTSGQNCSLTCNSSYVSTIVTLSCSEGSTTLDSACVEAPCTLPLFDNAITSGAVNGCNQSSVLPSNSGCSVQCAAGYAPGSSLYSCVRGVLTAPNLTCSPLSCSKSFGPNEVPDNSTGQECGSTLNSSSVCYTTCAPGFAGEAQYAFKCALGNLSTIDGNAGPTCTAMGCVLPAYPNSAVMSSSVSGCFPGDILPSGSSCTWACSSSAFYDLLGTNVFTCDRGVFTSVASMTCLPFACTLLPLGPDLIGMAMGSTPACNVSALLPHGKSCGVGCASLSLAGSSVYSCAAGVLSVPSAVCYNNKTQCVLNFAPSVVGEGQGEIFPCGRLLNGGSSCRVGCASGYVGDAGTRIYTCSATGVLTISASLQCLGSSCPVPDLSAQALMLTSPCVPATPVDFGCAFGYSFMNGSSSVSSVGGRGGGELVLSCAMCAGLCASLDSCLSYQCSPSILQCSLYSVFAPVNNVIVSDNVYCAKTGPACGFGYHAVVGDVLGSGKIGAHGNNENVLHCDVCASYCSSQSSCLSYECSPSLRRCNLNTIASPNGPALPSFSLCVKDAVPAPVPTGYLASGASCSVQCNGSYLDAAFPLNQSSLISCQGGQLSYPNVRCVPKPCVYPSQFPTGFGTPSVGTFQKCVPGGSVAVGSSCRVACAPYFYRTSGSGIATCSLGPSLSVPNLTCSPFLCSLPPSYRGYQVSGCPNNSSQSQCTVTCALGFSSTFPNGTFAGSVAAVCPSNGGVFEFSGCVAMQQCSLPTTTTGYSLSCSGSAPFLASVCSVSCATGFAGVASLSCPASGVITLSGCSSCACEEGTGRNGSCTSDCTACPPRTFNNGSSSNCTLCRPGTCVNQNQTGCHACTIGDPAELSSGGGISGGGVAAAVLVPLILIGLAVGGFFLWRRHKTHGPFWKEKWFQRFRRNKTPMVNETPDPTTSSTEMA